MVDYDSHAGSFSGGNDDLKLTMMPYAAIDGDFAGVRVGNSDFGQSLGERYEETVLVDGALYQRQDDESKVKLFSWQNLGFDPEDEEFKPAEFKRKSENYGGTTYNYRMVAARVDDTGEVWTTDDFPVNDDDQPVIGSVIIWNGGSQENGPNSTAKTAARTLTHLGRDAVVDEDDVYNWLAEGVETRAQLEDRRIRRFKVEREGEKFSFYTPVFIDVASGNRIGIPNDESDAASSGGQQAAATDGGTTTESGNASSGTASPQEPETPSAEAESSGSEFPPAIDDCLDYCVEQDITDRDDVMGTFNVMANNPESSISLEMIEDVGEEAIMSAIEARQ